MDRKRLETRLIEWSSDFGFTLPGNLPPPANYFSPLTATPHRCQLWETILDSVEPRDKVENIRKQLYLSKLKSSKLKANSKDFLLHAIHSASSDKIDLWKKKEALEKKIKERKEEISNLESEIENEAAGMQSDICRMAEIEKQSLEYKEKTMVLQLCAEKYKERLQHILKFLYQIKTCTNVYELESVIHEQESMQSKLKGIKDVKCTCNESSECYLKIKLEQTCKNEISDGAAWDCIVNYKKENIERFKNSLEEKWALEDEQLEEEKARLMPLKTSTEKIMLDISEKSLKVILNKLEEESLDLKIRKLFKYLEGGISGESNSDLSFLGPNESYEFGKNGSIMQLKEGLKFLGMKKRLEYLKNEMQRLDEDCEKKGIYLDEKNEADEKLIQSTEKLKNLYDEIQGLRSQLESSKDHIEEEHCNLISAIEKVNAKISDNSYIETLNNNVKDLKDSIKNYVDLFTEMPLDAFRKVKTSSGKELLECESLSHCMNNYGGEPRELFTAIMVSPYRSVEYILSLVEERKNFSNTITKIISNAENMLKEENQALANLSTNHNYEIVDKNNAEILKTLSKASVRLENMPAEMQLIERILNAWLEQPFRHMIPETKKVNGLSYRQYESQYQKSLDVLKYYIKMRKTC